MHDHVWSYVELFSETLIYDDVRSFQSYPMRQDPPVKLVMVGHRKNYY